VSNGLDKSLETDRWTISTLHEHLTLMLSEMDRRIEVRFDAQETAMETALVEARRATDKAEALRVEYILAQTALVERVNDMAGRLAADEGRSGQTKAIIPWLIAAAGVAIAIVSLFGT